MKNEELVNYLCTIEIKKSVYNFVVHDSETERELAKRLDELEDIKLFVKLSRWFVVNLPVGEHNPDWAVVKEEGPTLYLVRKTKGTRDILKSPNRDVEKVRCGQKHFEALSAPLAETLTANKI